MADEPAGQVGDQLASTGAVDLRPPDAPAPRRVPRLVHDEPSKADRNFNRITLAAGLFVLLLLTLVGVFLLLQSRNAISESGPWQFLTRVDWRTDVHPPRIGVLGLLLGTVLVAMVAVVIAIPLSVFAALAITEYAGARQRRILVGIVDLLAAIPSLLFGIWGFRYLSDKVIPISKWLTTHLGFIPFFKTDPGASFTGSIFIAGIVVALMVVPIITSVVREVFSQTPARREGGGAGPRRHALGDDPHGRAALRPWRHHRRLDARARPGAGRDDRRRPAAAGGADHVDQDPAERRRRPSRASSPTEPAPMRSPRRASWPPAWCCSSSRWPPTWSHRSSWRVAGPAWASSCEHDRRADHRPAPADGPSRRCRR